MMIPNSLIALVIGISTGISILLVSYSLSKLKSEVPKEEREYMDPLPPVLRMS